MPVDLSRPQPVVLFIDDDRDQLTAASLLLARRGYPMLAATGADEALSHLAAHPVDVVLLDLNFAPRAVSGEEGLRLLADILQLAPNMPVIVVTGHSGVNIAVSAMRAGAVDFIMKPWSNGRLMAAIDDVIARRGAGAPVVGKTPIDADLGVILGDSAAIRRVRDLVARAAITPASVLITGEAGVGKSLIARAINRQSASPQTAFAALDLGAAPSAGADDAGFIEGEVAAAFAAARGGDLVLEEIGGLSATMQARLSAFLTQNRRLGAPDDVRLIATTCRSRESLDGAGGLRADLLDHLSTLPIEVAPLRDRREDILVLAAHFVRLYSAAYGRPPRALSPAAAERVAGGSWPGNVRALRQAMERGVILGDGPLIEAADLQIGGLPADSVALATPAGGATLADSERRLVEAALSRHSFNVSRAAQDLGLTRAALYRRMAKHGL